MADFSPSTIAPEILRPAIESEIERLIAILDGMDADPDLEETADAETWLGWNGEGGLAGWYEDCKLDTADDEPSLGAVEARLPPPYMHFYGPMAGLFPGLHREPCELKYQTAGFHQLTWGADDSDDREDEHDGVEPLRGRGRPV